MTREQRVLEGYAAWPFRVRALPYAVLGMSTPVVVWAAWALAADPAGRDPSTVGTALAGIVALQIAVYLGVLLRAEQPSAEVARWLKQRSEGAAPPHDPAIDSRLEALRRLEVPASRWARAGTLATAGSLAAMVLGLWQLVEAYVHGGPALWRGAAACGLGAMVGAWGAASNARAELALVVRALEAAAARSG
ncbi:MAG: hypothetical protein IT376_12980 [Polyangiaceae bacterium]|nr:hypothetical protein [Polyangiaceae bacterium]